MRTTKQCQWVIGDGRHAGQQCRNAVKDEASGCCRWHARLWRRRNLLTADMFSPTVVTVYEAPGWIGVLDKPPPL